MSPSLWGRIQTRLLMVFLVGVPVALGLSAATSLTLIEAFAVLTVLMTLGVGWDLDYEALQRSRWDRDWPSIFLLLSIIPEALVAWPVLRVLGVAPSAGLYAVEVGVFWVTAFLLQQGPLRVVLPRWRFEGARVISNRVTLSTAPIADVAPEPIRSPAVRWLRPVAPNRRMAGLAFLGLAGLVAAALLVLPHPDHDRTPVASPPSPAALTAGRKPAPKRELLLDAWDTSARVAPVSLVAPVGRIRVQPVGLTSARTLAAPSDMSMIGWYSASPTPGQSGVAVLAGSSGGTSAALARLGDLRPGASLTVNRSDGSAVVFRVTKVVKAGASNFPTRLVYSPTTVPSLRVIGATGAGAAVQDVIVFATAYGLAPSHA